MARRGTGRWVARAASTGGGRTYRGQAPVRWYSALVLIVLLGVALVTYSRYELSNKTTPQPSTSDHWYSALAFDVCGATAPNLPTNPGTSSAGITTAGDGIIHTSPRTSAETGSNATLARFVREYSGLKLTSTTLKLPGGKTYTNGERCPTKTPNAGRAGTVQIKVWPSATGAGANNPTTASDPSSVKLANGQLITVAFVPRGTGIPKPPGQTIATLLNLVSGASSSTTTTPITPSSSSTSTPSATTPSSSTTTPSSSSTTKP